MRNKFSKIINKIFPQQLPKKMAVAVSGGIDSMALAFLLRELEGVELIYVTVDHKFRKDSGKEAVFVGDVLKKGGFEHVILESYLENQPQSNIESELREVRYNLLVSFCKEYGIDYLFIAHHEQDLAENFLIRLFRGSGIDGLASMDYITEFEGVNLVRPLLDFQKSELRKYLEDTEVPWVEDESNDDEKYLRNKIRGFLSGLKDSHLINQRIALASKSILQSRQIIEEEMVENSSKILEFNKLGFFLLKINSFKELHEQKAKRYLAWALMDVSGSEYKPRMNDLENLYEWIICDKKHKPRSCYGCVIEKFDDGKLIIYRERARIEKKKFFDGMVWDRRFILEGKEEEGVFIDIMDAEEFNDLIKSNLMKFRDLKNPLKKVFYTVPVLKKGVEIISIPSIGYGKESVAVRNKLNTKLANLCQS